MKKPIEYRIFYLITKILGFGLILLTLVGCMKPLTKEENGMDTSVNIFLETDTTSIDTLLLSVDTTEISVESVVDTVPRLIEEKDYHLLKLEKEKLYNLEKQKEKLNKLEMKLDSSSLKWDSIESAVKEYRK
jgi:hypothetical protein